MVLRSSPSNIFRDWGYNGPLWVRHWVLYNILLAVKPTLTGPRNPTKYLWLFGRRWTRKIPRLRTTGPILDVHVSSHNLCYQTRYLDHGFGCTYAFAPLVNTVSHTGTCVGHLYQDAIVSYENDCHGTRTTLSAGCMACEGTSQVVCRFTTKKV